MMTMNIGARQRKKSSGFDATLDAVSSPAPPPTIWPVTVQNQTRRRIGGIGDLFSRFFVSSYGQPAVKRF